MTLTEFLLARIEEDEAVAQAAFRDRGHYEGAHFDHFVVGRLDDGRWSVRGDHPLDECYVEGIGITIYDEGGHSAEQATHIARHDPARVLAECEAKRLIVELHHAYDSSGYCYLCGGDSPWPCDTLLALAGPYADHPDFCERWQA